jgi:hypothetical protein
MVTDADIPEDRPARLLAEMDAARAERWSAAQVRPEPLVSYAEDRDDHDHDLCKHGYLAAPTPDEASALSECLGQYLDSLHDPTHPTTLMEILAIIDEHRPPPAEPEWVEVPPTGATVPLDTDWVEALRLAATIHAGCTGAVLAGNQRKDFIETATWFYTNLRVPPPRADA